MKRNSLLLLLFLIIISCKKSNTAENISPVKVQTSFSINIQYGNNYYNTSNFTNLRNDGITYLYDGSIIGGELPACSAYAVNGGYNLARFNDTANGYVMIPVFFQFPIPAIKNFSNYNGKWITMIFRDTTYSGTATISASFTSINGQIANGSFDIRAVVSNNYMQSDSIPLTATMSFINLPF